MSREGLRKELNHQEKKEEIIRFLESEDNAIMVLATSCDDSVLARSVLIASNGLDIYFFTWGHSRKCIQLQKNPRVALCKDNVQVEGVAEILVMALAMTGAFVVPLLLAEEKEKHTLEFLLVSPTGPADVVAGKALTGLAYSLLIAGVLIALNQGWVRDWPVTLLAVPLGALFMVAVGLLMGSIFQTTMQVNTWSSIVM